MKTNTIPWAEAIKRGKQLVSKESDSQWELGELADQVEPKYGEETLEKFAGELLIEYAKLNRCRWVYRAFPENIDRSINLSFKHYAVVAGIKEPKERQKWLSMADKKGWPVRDLRAAIFKAAQDEEEEDEDENEKKEKKKNGKGNEGDIEKAFEIKAGTARSYATYSGPITKKVIAEARATLAMWAKLVKSLEEKFHG